MPGECQMRAPRAWSMQQTHLQVLLSIGQLVMGTELLAWARLRAQAEWEGQGTIAMQQPGQLCPCPRVACRRDVMRL